MMKKIYVFIILIISVQASFSQGTFTLPTLFNLSGGTFSFNNWDSLAAPGTFPADMRFYYTIQSESASGDGYDSAAEAARNYDCGFNLPSRNRIIGLDGGGFAFLATSSPQYDDCSGLDSTVADTNRYVGVAEVGLNSTGKTNIGVKWVGTIINLGNGSGTPANARENTVRLQYRVGTTGLYTDVMNNGNFVEWNSIGKDSGASGTLSVVLPAACNDQPVFYLRWVYFASQAAGSGTRPEISVNDIQIGANLLPLNLISFNAILNNGFVSLEWETLSEINFSNFEIEKSLDAQTFETIGEVPGKNIPGVHYYSFTDEKTLFGNAYYRLKMINKDGTYTYSGIVHITGKTAASLNIYPNPVADNLVLAHPAALQGAVLQIINMQGIKVAAYAVQQNAVQTSVDVSHFTRGNYIVVYNNGKTIQTAKFLKQ
jgi:hypothetical protein